MFLRLLSRVQLRTQALDGLDVRLVADSRQKNQNPRTSFEKVFVWFYYRPTATLNEFSRRLGGCRHLSYRELQEVIPQSDTLGKQSVTDTSPF